VFAILNAQTPKAHEADRRLTEAFSAKMTTNLCDKCQAPMRALSMLISGLTVFSCPQCRRLRIDGDNEWFDGQPGIVDRLLARAKLINRRPMEEPGD
jgi:hypothetical protein